ncbi:MAG: hypothetical protein KC478_07005 [Bacteriovoracaceae bacterium]|nr:hypothetical protein [Bacteriovoracaceae bacterium]
MTRWHRVSVTFMMLLTVLFTYNNCVLEQKTNKKIKKSDDQTLNTTSTTTGDTGTNGTDGTNGTTTSTDGTNGTTGTTGTTGTDGTNGTNGTTGDPVVVDEKALSVQAFSQTTHLLTKAHCMNCHGNFQQPLHAVADPTQAFDALIDTNKINFFDIPNSRLVTKLRVNMHNCWSNCASDAAELEQSIVNWKTIRDQLIAGATSGSNGGNTGPDGDQADIGIKNFEQINKTMSALTGVRIDRSNINNVYQDIIAQLPTDNKIDTFLAAHQVAVTKLAAEYCDTVVNDTTLRANVWSGFNFGATANNAFDSNGTSNFINLTLNSFWGLGVDLAGRSPAGLELQTLVNELKVGENLGASSTTRKIAKGVCIATLASLNVTML